MIRYILLAYILHSLSAPMWCWILYGIGVLLAAIDAGMRISKWSK